MKRGIIGIAFLLVPVFARAGNEGYLPESVQQARLVRFAPRREKSVDPRLSDRDFLLTIASDTWGYFRDLVDKENHLPLDNVIIASTWTKVNSYTSTTNVGLYLMSVVAASDLGFLTATEAVDRLKKTVVVLQGLDTWEGQFFNYYETITRRPSSAFVSSVDNGWLAVGLVVARQAFPDALSAAVDPLLDRLDFAKLYDAEVHQLHLGYETDKRAPSPYHYGMLCTEPRVASFLGIVKGDLPRRHWYHLYRTPPLDWDWQQRRPRGHRRVLDGVRFFAGHYAEDGVKYVPSWGGSLFEFLMPTLVMDEQRLSPGSFGRNNRRAVDLQIDYALDRMGYPVWGFSPCAVPEDPMGYKEYGVPYLGVKGYADEGVVTPHVSFLALAASPQKAVQNIRRLASMPGLYGEYGFYDSVNVLTGRVSPRFLSLDQGMTLIALDNHLNDGAIRRRFHAWPPVRAHEDLLTREEFF
jgi:hypothetical protein